MKARYTKVTRSKDCSEIGFLHNSDVFVSEPEPGEPLPARYDYPNEAAVARAGWQIALVPALQ